MRSHDIRRLILHASFLESINLPKGTTRAPKLIWRRFSCNFWKTFYSCSILKKKNAFESIFQKMPGYTYIYIYIYIYILYHIHIYTHAHTHRRKKEKVVVSWILNQFNNHRKLPKHTITQKKRLKNSMAYQLYTYRNIYTYTQTQQTRVKQQKNLYSISNIKV